QHQRRAEHRACVDAIAAEGFDPRDLVRMDEPEVEWEVLVEPGIEVLARVHVRVDEPREDEHAIGVEPLDPGRGAKGRCDLRDLAALDEDVDLHHLVEWKAAALDQQVVSHYSTPRRSRTHSGVATSRPDACTRSTARRTNWAFDSASSPLRK